MYQVRSYSILTPATLKASIFKDLAVPDYIHIKHQREENSVKPVGGTIDRERGINRGESVNSVLTNWIECILKGANDQRTRRALSGFGGEDVRPVLMVLEKYEEFRYPCKALMDKKVIAYKVHYPSEWDNQPIILATPPILTPDPPSHLSIKHSLISEVVRRQPTDRTPSKSIHSLIFNETKSTSYAAEGIRPFDAKRKKT